MYFYIPMGSITVVADEYVLTAEGIESNKRIPCLDALLGRMVELKSEKDIVESPVQEAPVQEAPVQEAPVVEASVIE